MKAFKKTKYITHVLLFTSLFLIVYPFNFFAPDINANQDLQEQLKQLEEEIKKLEEEQSQIQSQINNNNYLISGYSAELSKLYAEISILDKEVDKLNLEIDQLEVQVEILQEEINQKLKEIDQTEKDVTNLETETDERLKESYMGFRLYGDGLSGSDNILNLDNINDYFKSSQYKSIIQKDTNKLLTELARLKQELKIKKQELELKLIEVQKSKASIQIKKEDLLKKQSEVEAQMSVYYAQINALNLSNQQSQAAFAVLEEDEIKKRAEAEKVRQAIFNSFNPLQEGAYVVAGTMIGRQGDTGFATGYHLHFSVSYNGVNDNPCNYLPGGVVAGCGWGSSLQWPLSGGVFTSAFGNRCFWWGGTNYCDFHNGIDVVGSPWNAPVYAAHDGYLYKGVDSYGAKYIVICENTPCSSNQGFKTGYWHLSEY
ncbi:MAG: hypothetical protein KatS3mg086_193 [Candidatus Dojkabacteria bacterium]|nr:MAG: hypothetical protein KatS3mg086_193 [Candidatus Dojkabacteria bacterium]